MRQVTVMHYSNTVWACSSRSGSCNDRDADAQVAQGGSGSRATDRWAAASAVLGTGGRSAALRLIHEGMTRSSHVNKLPHGASKNLAGAAPVIPVNGSLTWFTVDVGHCGAARHLDNGAASNICLPCVSVGIYQVHRGPPCRVARVGCRDTDRSVAIDRPGAHGFGHNNQPHGALSRCRNHTAKLYGQLHLNVRPTRP